MNRTRMRSGRRLAGLAMIAALAGSVAAPVAIRAADAHPPELAAGRRLRSGARLSAATTVVQRRRHEQQISETVGVGGPPCIDYGKGRGLGMDDYDGNTVTALWNYAQHFAMSDNSYSTTFGPSTPGALNLIAGRTHGAMVVPDLANRSGSASGNVTAIDPVTQIGSVIGDPRPGPALDACTLPSPAARLPREPISR